MNNKNNIAIGILILIGGYFLISKKNKKGSINVPPVQGLPHIDNDTYGFDYDLFTPIYTFDGSETIVDAKQDPNSIFSLITFTDANNEMQKVYVLTNDLKY
jgi:hypothetical protein